MDSLHRQTCSINILGDFCGMRDLPELSVQGLKAQFGLERADIMVLFGGSILEGGAVLARAIEQNMAKRYLIVGGEGHTTESLRVQMSQLFPEWDVNTLSEARLFDGFIRKKYGLHADFLEERSTNCGNNITFMLELIRREGLACNSILLTQDAAMQRRMDAVLRKYVPECTLINYAAYSVKVLPSDGSLTFEIPPMGMWPMEHYVKLLMGEIPRLKDEGYGPLGKNFQAHVDIPQSVLEAFETLSAENSGLIRPADARYQSPESKDKDSACPGAGTVLY